MRRSGLRTCLALVTAVLVLPATGCGGGDQQGSAGPTSTSTLDSSEGSLQARPLDLPKVDYDPRTDVAGECFSTPGTQVGAIGITGIPGEGVLAPAQGRATAPILVRISPQIPRIVYLSALQTVKGSNYLANPTVWISRSAYRGPVLVRGGRIDEPGRVGFGLSPKPADELILPPGARQPWGDFHATVPADWRAASVPIRVASPGCYALRLDGPSFSYLVTFAVADA
jgi:hypothetical protein